MLAADEGCIFCAIVARRAPASIVHEDDLALAFMDIQPVNPGHLLVIPKAHHAALGEVPAATAAHLFAVAQRLAGAIRRSPLAPDGINLFLADGAAAGQEVFHCHLHVIPRSRGDGFNLRVDYRAPPARAALDALARQLAAADRRDGPA